MSEQKLEAVGGVGDQAGGSAPKGGSGHKRRVYLINPRFQLAFLGYMVGVSAVAILVFYGANLYFFGEFASTGKALGLPPNHVYFEFLNSQRQTMNQLFSITSAVCFVLLCLGGLAFSHRVAGPLYRLNRHMQDVAEGKTRRPVKFRQGDFFPEIAVAYNAQLEALVGSEGGATSKAEGGSGGFEEKKAA